MGDAKLVVRYQSLKGSTSCKPRMAWTMPSAPTENSPLPVGGWWHYWCRARKRRRSFLRDMLVVWRWLACAILAQAAPPLILGFDSHPPTTKVGDAKLVVRYQSLKGSTSCKPRMAWTMPSAPTENSPLPVGGWWHYWCLTGTLKTIIVLHVSTMAPLAETGFMILMSKNQWESEIDLFGRG